MSNKYDSSEHIKVLAELLTLQDMVNETQIKIISAKKKLDKMNETTTNKLLDLLRVLIDKVNTNAKNINKLAEEIAKLKEVKHD